MFNIANIKGAVVRPLYRGALLAKKFSPEILVGVGVVGVIATAVLASRATLKAEPIMNDHERLLHQIQGEVLADEITEEQAKRAIVEVYVGTVTGIAKLYILPISVAAISITCLLGAHGIMRQRNAALGLTLAAIDRGFSAYRANVVDELGEDADRDFLHGRREHKVTIEDEKGELVTKRVSVVDPNGYSMYARVFNQDCPEWTPNADYNLLLLRNKQSYANDMLKTRGHVFLNEVYDSIGLPRTQAGAITGWVISKDGDNCIDFGIYDATRPGAADFVNGYANSVMLDFNVDGVIYNLI